MSRYIITGAAGAGKTTLLHELINRGYRGCEESAREVIKHELFSGSDGMPWSNMDRFTVLTYQHMLSVHLELHKELSSVVFFDRAIPDVIAYRKAFKLPIEASWYNSLDEVNYDHVAFILPPSAAIFKNDNERQESYELACYLFEYLQITYIELGFKLYELALQPVEKRADEIDLFLNQ